MMTFGSPHRIRQYGVETGHRLLAFLAAGLLLSGGWTPPAIAAASDPVEDDLNRQGFEARKRSDDAAALDFFRRAYQLHRSPRAAAQMGLAEVALGRWEDADIHLGEALGAPADPWIQKNDKVLMDTLERVRKQFGSLQVLGGPAGAEVVVEGRVVGLLPMKKAVRVRNGECRLEIRAPGYASANRTVTITASNPTRETVELSPPQVVTTAHTMAPPPKDGRDSIPAAPETTSLIPPKQLSAQPVSDEKRTQARLRTVGIALAGVGVAAIGAGVTFGLEARSAGNTNSQVGNTFDPDADRRGKRQQTAQYVSLGVGAALVAAGAVTFALGVTSDREANNTHAALLPLAEGGAVAAWSGRF